MMKGTEIDKKHIGTGLIGVIFTLCLLFILLITSVEAVCYWTPGYFEQEYEKYDVLSDLPDMTMSEEDGLMAVTEHMMHYLRGDEGYDDLQIEVRMDGELKGFFTDREIAHMKDVRDLFVGAQRLRLFAAVICLICLVSMYLILPLEVFDKSYLRCIFLIKISHYDRDLFQSCKLCGPPSPLTGNDGIGYACLSYYQRLKDAESLYGIRKLPEAFLIKVLSWLGPVRLYERGPYISSF